MKQELFENANKTEKLLGRPRQKRVKKRNKRGDITRDSTDIKRVIREQYKKLYALEIKNTDEMDKFFDRHKLPKFIQVKIT